MSKTLKITLISIAIILILGLVGFLFFYKNKMGDNGVDIIKNTLPFGNTSSNPVITPEKNSTSDKNTGGWMGDVSKPRLFQIHKNAIAGYYTFKLGDKTVTQYTERGTGHIFETDMQNLKETRISNTTRLKIYKAIGGSSGKNVIIRYLDDTNGKTIRSFVVTLANIKTKDPLGEEAPMKPQTQKTEGLFLPENIKEIVRSEQEDKNIFYLFNYKDSSVGTIYNLESGKSKQVFQSPFTEWLPQWPNENIITLTSKASVGVPGFLYFLNTKNQGLTKILGGIKGLTTLTSPDGENILYSKSNNGWVSLNIYERKTHSSRALPLSTLSEKCVWSKIDKNIIYCAIPNNPEIDEYPDKWYKGLLSFSDDIWKINIETYATERILSPVSIARESIDAINLQIDSDDRFLFLTNKKDMSLWGIKLKEDTNLNAD